MKLASRFLCRPSIIDKNPARSLSSFDGNEEDDVEPTRLLRLKSDLSRGEYATRGEEDKTPGVLGDAPPPLRPSEEGIAGLLEPKVPDPCLRYGTA